MNNNWELFQNAYLTADNATKAVIDSEAIPNAIDALITAGSLVEEQRQTVMRIFPLLVLQVYTKEQVAAELEAAGIQNPTATVEQLQSHMPAGNSALHTVESAHPAGLRTMADDMHYAKHPEDAPSYTSSQEALLREGRASQSATPSPTDASLQPATTDAPAATPTSVTPTESISAPPTTAPRWDSERES